MVFTCKPTRSGPVVTIVFYLLLLYYLLFTIIYIVEIIPVVSSSPSKFCTNERARLFGMFSWKYARKALMLLALLGQ